MRGPEDSRKFCRIRTVVGFLAIAATAFSCSRWQGRGDPNLVVPRLDNARDQFYYAAKIDEQTLVGRESIKRRERLSRVIAAYQAVLDHFPSDKLHAPLALASIGNCYFELEEYRKTIKLFQDAEQRYPNNPFIHAQAEWKTGQSYEALGRQRRAKFHYKRCIDTFAHERNEQVQQIVKYCMSRWLATAVEGETPRKQERPKE